EVELPEITVVRVERPDAVLQEQGGKMRVGHQIPPRVHGIGDRPVHLPEAFLLGEHANLGKPQQRADVRGRRLLRQWTHEDTRMRRDTQIPRDRRPPQAEHLGAHRTVVEEAPGARVVGALLVGSVEKDVDVQRIAHLRSRFRSITSYSVSRSEMSARAVMSWECQEKAGAGRRARRYA